MSHPAAAPRTGRGQTSVPGALAQVRAATRGTHEALDALLPFGLRHLADYRRYLAALRPLAEWLALGWRPGWPAQLACWHDAARLDALRHDVRALGLPADPGPGPRPAATPAEWLGGCYVIEGSALGARLLSRHLDRLAPGAPEVAGARRFLDHLTADPVRWRRFSRLLDGLPAGQAGDAVAGARTGFGLVHARLAAQETA